MEKNAGHKRPGSDDDEMWHSSDQVVAVQVKRPLDKVIPVRLSSESWQALYEEAEELGVGPTTLARMWILAQLRQLRATRPAPKKEAPKRKKRVAAR